MIIRKFFKTAPGRLWKQQYILYKEKKIVQKNLRGEVKEVFYEQYENDTCIKIFFKKT